MNHKNSHKKKSLIISSKEMQKKKYFSILQLLQIKNYILDVKLCDIIIIKVFILN